MIVHECDEPGCRFLTTNKYCDYHGMSKEQRDQRYIDLEPDDGLGPALRDESGRMSENTHLVRRVLLLERTIRDAKAILEDIRIPLGEREVRAYDVLHSLPVPER